MCACLQERHDPGYEAVPSPLEYPDKRREEGGTKYDHEEQTLDQVCYEELWRGLVEPVFLF